jgi:uncharacterized protein YjiS (DUF1127 family)
MDMKHFESIQDPIARAEAMRGQAIADLIIHGAVGVRRLVGSAAAKLAAYLNYRRTYDALSAMTDRELDDIGIKREEILAVARGADPRKKAGPAAGDAQAQRLALGEAFAQNAAAPETPASNDDGRRTAAAA